MQDIHLLFPATPKGWQYQFVYKPIRNIYFRIYPDKKVIRISAPSRISKKAIKQAIAAKSAWLMQKLTAFDNASTPCNPLSAMRDSTSCMVWGRQLPVVRQVCNARPCICLTPESEIVIQAPAGFDPGKEDKLWNKWLRMLLNERIHILLEKWLPVMGVAPTQCRLKKMRTRWGSCNTVAKRIWINSVLVHRDPCLLEYVLVHELVHLLESRHSRRFYQILETYLPDWKAREGCLNQSH
ncbi:SprT family zinc-dependent metalloprotease [uncultured Desulfobacter sp.]|uniref:M48 family metallopeptidase n=1 Tax=uncultured Desulfobacter sp. TaxID=240139 RepID=UPI002AAB38A2|nr:SprT family zinc-dependent metalloprotease [uncultured Desulfobacter sp.]